MEKTKAQLNQEASQRAYDEFIANGGVVTVFESGKRSDPSTIKTTWGRPASKTKTSK